MVFLWFSHDFPIFPMGFPLFLCFSYGFPMIFQQLRPGHRLKLSFQQPSLGAAEPVPGAAAGHTEPDAHGSLGPGRPGVRFNNADMYRSTHLSFIYKNIYLSIYIFIYIYIMLLLM